MYQVLRYCHDEALPGCKLLHRDLKPDNIGFRPDGTPAPPPPPPPPPPPTPPPPARRVLRLGPTVVRRAR